MVKHVSLLSFIFFGICFTSLAQSSDTGAVFTFITNRYFDCGGLTVRSETACKFQFKNTGDKPLIISEMHCAPVEKNAPPLVIHIRYPTKPVRPGKKGIIEITVTAIDNIGSFQYKAYVTSNATSANYPLLLLTGAVVPVHAERNEPEADMSGFFEFLVPVVKAIAN
jgi:hypothetical protein